MQEVVLEESHLYSSTYIVRHINSRKMRWAGHVACTGEERKCTRFWWESLKERDHSEDQGVDGRMGSEWIMAHSRLGIHITCMENMRKVLI
jgi:hypothetical protein